MIFILTVHWKTERWIDIQRKFLRRYVSEAYQTYVSYTGIGQEAVGCFDRTFQTETQSHADKLNSLAAAVIDQGASDSDILLFLDGDAFPVRPLFPDLNAYLREFPLVAICRTEQGEPQPHPSFCATTVGFWRQIEGDWRKGHEWEIRGRKTTDVGGNLLGLLRRSKTKWLRLLRSHSVGGHGLYFGVYGSIVYHHGAGFRVPYSTFDMLADPWGRFLFRRTPERYWNRISRLLVPKSGLILKNAKGSQIVFERIVSDEHFFDDLDSRKITSEPTFGLDAVR